MKYLLHRDTILATLFLLLVLWLLSVTIKTGVLEPGKIEPYDFDYTDLVYSLSGPAKTRFDPDVVIVNVGDTDRAGIAAIIEKVNSYHPGAIGLDLLFEGKKTGDAALANAIARTPNLVAAYVKNVEGEGAGGAMAGAQHYGYVNLSGKKGSVVRYFLPFYKEHTRDWTSFATEIVRTCRPGSFSKLQDSKKSPLAINYARRDSEYLVINYPMLLYGNIPPSAISGKIVLIGLYSVDSNNIEDKHLTPKNPVFFGRSLPDMHGVVIHANIISMILVGAYIHSLPPWFSVLLAVLTGWVCTAIFIKYLVNKQIWFHTVVRIWQSAVLFMFIALSVLLFLFFRVKVDINLSLVVLVLSAEILYLYEILAIWLARRFKYKTVFKPHKE